ncbi:MAG: hypothetical protein ABEL51_06100, partial [Salinibacter sp.]
PDTGWENSGQTIQTTARTSAIYRDVFAVGREVYVIQSENRMVRTARCGLRSDVKGIRVVMKYAI